MFFQPDLDVAGIVDTGRRAFGIKEHHDQRRGSHGGHHDQTPACFLGVAGFRQADLPLPFPYQRIAVAVLQHAVAGVDLLVGGGGDATA